MLERLNTVDWARLRHAYGKATNVPRMIKALAARERNRREAAYDGLLWSIHHQGTIYDATAPAVPFLLELAAAPAVPDRFRILDLIQAVAGGYGYVQVHGRFETRTRQASASFRAQLAQERAWQDAVRAAVWQGWPLYLALLGDANPRLRRGARRVIARLLRIPRPELAPALPALADRLRDPALPERGRLFRTLGEAVRWHADPDAATAAAADHRAQEVDLANGDLDRGAEPTPEWLRPTPEELGWSRAALNALAAFGPPAAGSGGLFLRAMLARYAADQPREPLLAEWLAELAGAQPRRQANLLFALATVAPEDPRVVAALDERLRATRSRLVAYVAALKLVDLTGVVPDRGLDLLAAAQQGQRGLYDRLRRLPRWDNYLAIPRLLRLGAGVVERLLPRFLAAVRSAGTQGGLGAGRVNEILRFAFAGGPLPAGATGEDLSGAQRALLAAAADNGFFWGRMANNDLELRRLGLPTERRALRQFLASPGEPIGPPPLDPEEARVTFERLVRSALPFQEGMGPAVPEGADGRAPFRVIRETVEHLRRVEANYRPQDRPQVHVLELCGYARDELLALVPLCPNLRELDLMGGEVTDAGLAHLAKLPALKVLDLYGNGITDAGLAHLAALTGLRKLALGGTAITDAGLRHLAGLTAVAELNLGGTGVAGPGLRHLAGWQRLQDLWLCGDRLTDAATPLIGQFRGLKKLAFGGRGQTWAGLEAWAGLTRLRELRLQGAPIPAAALAKLPALPALQELYGDEGQLTADAVQALPPLPALRALGLRGGHTTDAALEGLERFPALRRLDLSRTAVTDAGARRLLGLKRLEWVGLFDTAVGDAVVAELKAAFPKAAIGR